MNAVHLDLFSGIGGFALGLQRAGFKVDKHYFSEVDKHAIANYRHNFKNAEYVGSVTDVRGRELEAKPTIITFGSPCQDFSLAGKRKGMEGQRSGLVLEAIRLISETRPNLFIWENVKGTFSSNEGRDFQAILRELTNIGGYRLEWQLLNTSWLLPQNRERIYLIGHLGKGSGRGVFPFGEDDQVFKNSSRAGQGQSQAKYYSTIVRPGMGSKADDTFIEAPIKAGALTGGGHSGGLHSDMTTIKVKSATNQGFEEATKGDSINLNQPDSQTRRGRVGKQKANTLETSCNQGVISTILPGRHVGQNDQREKPENEPHFTLDASQSTGVAIGPRIRRLTEIECERLQGFPDNWTQNGINDKGEPIKISRTQRYKMCGNAVTVAIVQMISERLLTINQNPTQ